MTDGSPERPPTSVPLWMTERSRNGGVDEIPLPRGPGRLWLCGKHFIGPDVEAALARLDATTAVCLNEVGELASRYPAYVEWLTTNQPQRAVWFPVPDLHAPDIDVTVAFLDDLTARLEAGERILLHCGAGAPAVLLETPGRTGMRVHSTSTCRRRCRPEP
jgi:hypothetical protein